MKSLKTLLPIHWVLLLAVFFVTGLVGFSAAFATTSVEASHTTKCEDVCIALGNDKASPDTIAVEVGTYVQFNSADGKTHNLSLGDGGDEHDHHGKFYSGEFKADEAWRVQFNEEGTFHFHDHLNPKLNVLVVVYTAGKDYKIQ